MSQAYVPDKVYLVCTNGTMKSQMNVTSQTTVKIAGLRLAATIEDRFTGNFFCAKMVVAGALIGAVVAAVFVVGTIASGGTLGVAAIAAIGAAGAAGGAATGALAAMMPSICSMLTSPNDWAVVHPRVKIEGKRALIEDSKIPCTLGGNVLILYSLEAAEDFTDLRTWQTVADVGGIILGSALVSVSVGAVFTGGAAFFGSVKLINATFGSAAAWKFAGEGALWLAGGMLASYGADEAKGAAYEQLGIGDYADGKYEDRADELINLENIVDDRNAPSRVNTDESTNHYEVASGADIVGDGSGVPGEMKPKISEYEDWDYERRTGMHTADGSTVEEYESQRESTRNPRSTRERNPNVITESRNDHTAGRDGAYYNRENARLESGRQLDRTNLSDIRSRGIGSLKNAIPDSDFFFKPEGKPRVPPIELAVDAWRILTNKYLLEGAIKNLEKSLGKEAEARAAIKVIEKEI